MTRRFLIFIVVLAFAGLTAKAQQHVILLKALSKGDSIILRWTPSSAENWFLLNRSGYKIDRIDLDGAKRQISLTENPLLPFTVDQMKNQLDPHDPNEMMAAQALYGQNFNANTRKDAEGSIIDQSSIDGMRYSFSVMAADFSPRAATALAMRWADMKVERGKSYAYLVYPAKPITGTVYDTAAVVVLNAPDNNKYTAPAGFSVIGGDRTALLKWDRYQQGEYSGFFIEKSGNGTQFHSLTERPYFSAMPDTSGISADSSEQRRLLMEELQHYSLFHDSLSENYKPYYYRIRGINAFGELSPWSPVISIAGRDLTPPSSPVAFTPRFLDKRNIRISWVKSLKEPDLKGYYILRSNDVAGSYDYINKTALPISDTVFIDTAAYAHGSNFYIVVALDTAGNTSFSFPVMGLVPDLTAPAIPRAPSGKIDSAGWVSLHWPPNKDIDLKGYHVYFANSPDHAFSRLNREVVTDTSFIEKISLKTLTKEIWYKIAAVDLSNNFSDYSQAIKLRKPDTIPPVAPRLRSSRIVKDTVQLEWIQSSSADVSSYTVYRMKNNEDWKAIGKINHHPSALSFSFSDTGIEPNTLYHYAAAAVDEDGNYSQRSMAIPIRIHRSSTSLNNAQSTDTSGGNTRSKSASGASGSSSSSTSLNNSQSTDTSGRNTSSKNASGASGSSSSSISPNKTKSTQ